MERMRRVLLSVAALLLSLALVSNAEGTPAYPGAKRRTDATGRWYVAVEGRSDRCALVECASNAPRLAKFHDGGAGEFGLPGPNPIRPGDRVVVRARIQGYPIDFLPASDGSGFAAITQDYGPPGFPNGDIVALLNWVPAKGPRVVFVLPKPPPPKMMISYGTPWRVQRIAVPSGLIVVSAGHDQPSTIVRIADGATRTRSPLRPAAALDPKQVFKRPARSPFVIGKVRNAQSRARALAAMRGEAPLRLSPFERIPVIVRAFGLLGTDAGEVLLGMLDGPLPSIVDPERNVVRAAYWTLGARPEGVALAAKAIFDRSRSAHVRAASVWLLAGTLGPGRFKPLLEARADPDPRVSGTAVSALADHRWDAGAAFIRLLDDAHGHESAVARFFEAYRVKGSVPGLLRALKRTKPKTQLRGTLAKALQTQTALTRVGEDPAAWERALSARRPK